MAAWHNGPARHAALLPFLEHAINLGFSKLDCQGSANPSYTGFAFAVTKPDFPSPTAAMAQRRSILLHCIASDLLRVRAELGIGQNDCPVCSFVYLTGEAGDSALRLKAPRQNRRERYERALGPPHLRSPATFTGGATVQANYLAI